MPHILVTRPEHDRARSLGGLAAAWIEHHYRHGVGDVAYEPYELDDDFYVFILDAYALDENGQRLYRVVVLSRPKGTAKSELAAALALFDAAGPSRFDGWAQGGEYYEDPETGFIYEYEPGEPMGRRMKSARLRFMATEKGQVGETYDNIILNLSANGDAETPDEQPPLWAAWQHRTDFFAGLAKTVLPGGATLTPSATGASSKDGGKDTLTIVDEVHLYTQDRQVKALHTLARNLLKRKKAEGWILATTTMHERGQESLGELYYADAMEILNGEKENTGLLYDHREGFPVDDLNDAEAVEASLREAYDHREWINYDGYVAACKGGAVDMGGPQEFRRYFLNQEVSGANAFMMHDELQRSHYLDDGCTQPVPPLQPGEHITLGLDFAPGTAGGRAVKRVPDSTAIIACRLSDMSLHIISLQEAPANAAKTGWAPSVHEMATALDDVFAKHPVAAFYADPSHIQSYLTDWQLKYGARVPLKASPQGHFFYYMSGKSGGKFSQRIKTFEEELAAGRVHIFEDYRLVKHFGNARRVLTAHGVALFKETPDSPNKIDAAIAGIMAHAAAMDARSRGYTGVRTVRKRKQLRQLR